jgi:hypothetical protein
MTALFHFPEPGAAGPIRTPLKRRIIRRRWHLPLGCRPSWAKMLFNVFEASNGDDGGDIRSPYLQAKSCLNMLFIEIERIGHRLAWCRFTLEPETGVDLGKKWH